MTIGLVTGAQRPIIVSPRWTIVNQVSLPTGLSAAPDIAIRYTHAVQFVFVATITLGNFFPPPDNPSMTSEFILSKPFWNVANTLVLPVLSDDNGDGIPKLRSLISLSLPITIFLDSILGEPATGVRESGSGGGGGGAANPFGRSTRARSLGEDQLNIFRSIEDSLASLGVDGRTCLLRLICELQGNSIGRYTVVGELLTLLFTPKRGINDFLHDYIEAEEAGRGGEDCSLRYMSCPFSLTGTLEKYRRYMQSVSSADDKPGTNDHSSFANTIGNDHFALPKVVLN